MAMTLPSISTTDEDKATQAWLAVRRFDDLLPSLNSWARALTNDDSIRVVKSTGTPCTDGKTIFMRPPFELGTAAPHGESSLCNKRDDRTVLICEACRAEEDVLVTLYHEIAHIIFGSFDTIADRDARDVVVRAVQEADTDDSSRVAKLAQRIDEARPSGYMHAANLISPYLGPILNAYEDARVNRQMFTARPGTKIMFRGHTVSVLEDGVHQLDGSVTRWDEMPGNSQAIIGLFAKASGYDVAGWFAPEVEALLETEDVAKVIAQMDTARSVKAVYRLGFPTLEALRKHGFCKAPDDPEDDPTPKDESDPEGEGKSEPTERQDEAGEAEPAQPQSQEGEAPGESDPECSDGDAGDAEGDPEPGDRGGEDGDQLDADDAFTEAGGEAEASGSAGTEANAEGAEGDEATSADEATEATEGATEASAEADEAEATSATEAGAEGDEAGADEGADAEEPEAGEPEPPDQEGTPEEVARALEVFGGHAPLSEHEQSEQDEKDAEIDRAVVQVDHFDAPSQAVAGIRLHDPDTTDGLRRWGAAWNRYSGTPDVKVAERYLGPALQQMRLTFAENQAGKRQRNLKAGPSINNRVLAKRAPIGDPRVFSKRTLPGRRNYFVVLGLDVSASTSDDGRIHLIKAAAMAQAELLHRVGVPFAVYAHSANYSEAHPDFLDCDLYQIKGPSEPWSDKTRQRVSSLMPVNGALDGHTMEFYRKVLDKQTATDKVILYYTDGEMPAANYTEELEILRREINLCRRKGYTVAGVGVHTDSPKAHGLETVQIDRLEDLPRVVTFLKDRLI